MTHRHIIAHDGMSMINDTGFDFASYFDWVITANTIIRYKPIPSTIYVKVDYLDQFAHRVLPKLSSPFILISGCGDASPSINFPEAFKIIIENQNVKYWFMENCSTSHPKARSVSIGLTSYIDKTRPTAYEDALLELRAQNIQKRNKVLCCWRPHSNNICGPEYVQRTAQLETWVKEHSDIFDWHDPWSPSPEERRCKSTLHTKITNFGKLVHKYKFILNPVGNGLDPSPTCTVSMIVNTIPIIKDSITVNNLYRDCPCAIINDWSQVIQPKFLDEIEAKYRSQIELPDTIHRISQKYIADKITGMI